MAAQSGLEEIQDAGVFLDSPAQADPQEPVEQNPLSLQQAPALDSEAMGPGEVPPQGHAIDDQPLSSQVEAAMPPVLSQTDHRNWTRGVAMQQLEELERAGDESKFGHWYFHEEMQSVRRRCNTQDPPSKISISATASDFNFLASLALLQRLNKWRDIFGEQNGKGGVAQVWWVVFDEDDENHALMPNTPFKLDFVLLYADGSYIRVHPRSWSRPDVRLGRSSDLAIQNIPENSAINMQ